VVLRRQRHPRPDRRLRRRQLLCGTGAVSATTVQLGWSTYTAAAGEAGLSREYGGIHFRDADAHGLNLGRAVGTNTWNKAQTYFQGVAAG
jgi:hypothetical protein